MPKKQSIPEAAKLSYEAVISLINATCQTRLNEEWADLGCRLAASLARKRPSPLNRGRPEDWAAGIMHALGMVNFLFDRTQSLSMTVSDLSTLFNTKTSTMTNRSRTIRNLIPMYQMDPAWTLPSQMADNPIAWMIKVNGFVIDARTTSPEIQQEAYRLGLIPYIPDEPGDDSSGMPS